MFCLGGQAEVQAAYEEEFAAYEAGLYREQPRDWLATSWQGDALQVSPSYTHAVLPAPWPEALLCFSAAHVVSAHETRALLQRNKALLRPQWLIADTKSQILISISDNLHRED